MEISRAVYKSDELIFFGLGVIRQDKSEFRPVIGYHVDIDTGILGITFDAHRAAAVDLSVVHSVLFFGRVVDQHVVYIRSAESVFNVFEMFVSHDTVYFAQVVVFADQGHVVDDDGIGSEAYRVGDIESSVEIVDTEAEAVDQGRAFDVESLEPAVEIDFTGGMSIYVFEYLLGDGVEKCQRDVLGVEVQVQRVSGGEDVSVDPCVGVIGLRNGTVEENAFVLVSHRLNRLRSPNVAWL